MRFAIATHSFLLALDLNSQWEVESYDLLDSGYYYGLALEPGSDDDQLLIAFRGGESLADQTTPELRTYRCGAGFERIESKALDDSLGHVHQIAFANDGLYVANTKFNNLVYLAQGSGNRASYTFGGISHDYNHVNSVFPCGGQILAVLHNRHRKASELAVMRHSTEEGLALEVLLSLWDECCHNIFVDGDLLVYNASTARELVVVDPGRNRVRKRLSFGGHHTKGLSVTEKYIAVGLSEHTRRERRSSSTGHLAIVDRETLQPVAQIDLNFDGLPHPVGNVNEVRCLSEPELGHSRNSPAGIEWSPNGLARASWIGYQSFRVRTWALIPPRAIKSKLQRFISRFD